MRIHQIVVGASPGDAVTGCALMVARALRAAGVESHVYALHRDHRLQGEVHRLDDYPPGDGADLLIFHASIGDQRVIDFVLRCREQLVLVYHNITPPKYFDDFDPVFAGLLRSGRSSLRQLAGRAIGALADSSYNGDELRALGMTNVEVVPPALDLRRLTDAEVDQPLVAQLADIDSAVVLCVGQLLPHKRTDLAIAAHHLLNVNYSPTARLVLAGPPRNRQYANALIRYVQSLNLPTVWLTGEITDSQLAAFYRRADVLVVPSEHEGFGVPVVEAFHFGVPVIARDFGAIRETSRGAAIILDHDSGAFELCEAVAHVLHDESLREELRRRGRLVAADMTPDRTVVETLAALLRVIANAPSTDLAAMR